MHNSHVGIFPVPFYFFTYIYNMLSVIHALPIMVPSLESRPQRLSIDVAPISVIYANTSINVSTSAKQVNIEM